MVYQESGSPPPSPTDAGHRGGAKKKHFYKYIINVRKKRRKYELSGLCDNVERKERRPREGEINISDGHPK